MKTLIFLAVFAIVFRLGTSHMYGEPKGKVTCYNNNTVDIKITNVDDLNEWTVDEWQLKSKNECKPVFGNETVTYSALKLPDCAWSLEQPTNSSIKYVLKINPTKKNSSTGQLRGYEHLYYVWCSYVNENVSTASFVPIKNREHNDSSTAFFSFNLEAFIYPNYTGRVPDKVPLKTVLYFQASVETSSSAPNLDLFPVHCYSSKNRDPTSTEGQVTLIEEGCGNKDTSKDLEDTLSYSCANDSIKEKFSIQAFRYYGAEAGDAVYFHCVLRVCLADKTPSACECPSSSQCPSSRKKRSTADETKVYRVSTGPFILENDEEEKETGSGEENESKSLSNGTVITVAISGVLAVAIICLTAYLILRSRNKRSQRGDIHVAT